MDKIEKIEKILQIRLALYGVLGENTLQDTIKSILSDISEVINE